MAVETSADVAVDTASPGSDTGDAAGTGLLGPGLPPAATASGRPLGLSGAQSVDRFGQLDFLRGIAAATVVVGHLMRSVPAIDDHSQAFWALKYTPLHVFWAGHQAVIFFFVLSGFVLALPFYSRAVSYRAFVVKRVLRICVPYWAAVVLAAFASQEFSRHGIAGLSTWFNSWWNDPLSYELLLSHLFLIGSFRNDVLDPVLWSLVHEMRISLAFPLLMAFLLRRRWPTTLLAAAGLGVIGLAITYFSRRLGHENDFGATCGYVFMFAVGALLCRHRAALVDWFKGLSLLWRWTWMLLALLAYTYPFWFLPSTPFLHLSLVDDYVTAAGVAVVIVGVLGSRSTGRVLRVPPLPWLGKVSYSLYLLHAVVLLTLLSLLFGAIPLWSIWALTLLISLPLAAASHQLLERPSIALGHRLAGVTWPARGGSARPGGAWIRLIGRSPAPDLPARRSPRRRAARLGCLRQGGSPHPRSTGSGACGRDSESGNKRTD